MVLLLVLLWALMWMGDGGIWRWGGSGSQARFGGLGGLLGRRSGFALVMSAYVWRGRGERRKDLGDLVDFVFTLE